MQILILCTGNSCRSQMAHGFLQSFDPDITVCSAGTEASGKLNQKAVAAMKEVGIDISHHTSDSVDLYLDQEWDYVITVCGGANENCPAFLGKVKHRLHIGFDDPSHAIGTDEFIRSEYIRVRDEIKEGFYQFYHENQKSNTMIYYIIKVLLSSVTIVAISEISKRSTLAGSILASIPIVSLLAFVWMYIDTKDTAKIAGLSQGIFWLVIPSLLFFLLFPAMLKRNIDFWWSLGVSLTIMILGYFVMLFLLKRAGIQI